ncbi:MAG: TIGR02996 domain-containing protein [Gemmataceae bacterium]|nr:TIGR02996 domain-containing protein [Gemmataceae bacterium]
MTDREALYRAILDSPDDDTPRLVYADWLDDHGDPEYARFIRAQVELARVPEWDPLYIRTWEHDREAFVGSAFRGRFPRAVTRGPHGALYEFRRGFPWEVHVPTPARFAEEATTLLAAAPVQAVVVGNSPGPPDLGPLADSPHLTRVRRLVCSTAPVSAEGVRLLAGSPHAAGLTFLGFGYRGITAAGACELFRSRLLSRLTHLRLEVAADAGSSPAAAIAAAGGPHRLRGLYLTPGDDITEDLTGALAAPLLRGLVELELCAFLLGPGGYAALAASPAAPTLESLTLIGTAPGVPGVRTLAGAPTLANLRRLNLRSNNLGPGAARALARSRHLSHLVDLDLHGNPLGDSGAVALADSPYLRNLVRLDLGWAKVGDRGALALLDSPVTANLVRLDLYQASNVNRISDDVRKRLRDRFGNRVHV